MASTVIDRATGVALISAIKAPCRVATTTNITLYGEQTIDGIAVVAGDRVLVKNQTAAAENGVYVVDTGGWDRAPDFDSSRDIQQYVRVYVGAGSENANTEWVLTTDSPVPDTTVLNFSRVHATAATFKTQSVVVAAEIPPDITTIRTMGYASEGDGGDWPIAVRTASEPAAGAKVRSADRWLPNGAASPSNGGWWQLKARRVHLAHFGAIADAGADCTSAIQRALDAIAAGEYDVVEASPGVYLHSGLVLKNKSAIVCPAGAPAKFRMLAGANADAWVSDGAYDFISGARTDFENVPSDIRLENIVVDGNWADWTFPRSPSAQPVYNTSGNGLVLYTQRSRIDALIFNIPGVGFYYNRAATDSVADGYQRDASGRLNLRVRFTKKQGAVILNSDLYHEAIQVVGAAALMNGAAPTASTLVTDAEDDVAGLVLSGGEYGNIHVSGPHQGASGDDSPAIKIVGGIVAIGQATAENCRSGVFVRSGHVSIGSGIIRDPKDTTTSCYQFKVHSDASYCKAALKIRRYSGANGSNADSDFKSVQIEGSGGSYEIDWFNATNPVSSALFNGDAVSVSGDRNYLRVNTNSAAGSAVILESGADSNKVDLVDNGSSAALKKLTAGANTVEMSTKGNTTGIVSTTLANRERISGQIGIASGGAYASGTTPTVSSGAKWDLVGITSTLAVGAVTEVCGTSAGSIATGATYALVTIDLPETMMWAPSVAQVRLGISSTTTALVTAQIYAVSTTQLTVRLATPTAPGSTLNVTISYSIDLNS